ncbi:hypothetical protein [Halomonas denitrificans]|nr:hypothetical protein [Halomonas denitrificans]
MTAVRDAIPVDPENGSTEERLRLPLLRERLDRIGADREHWLDFGGVQPALVDRLAAGPNRLVVARLSLKSRDDALPVSFHLLERSPAPETFDVLLAWDWLNHFDAADLQRLGARLARHARSGARLHALIHYASKAMPAAPVDYRLTADGDVLFERTDPGPRPAPRYSPKALEKAMPDWQVDRTMLLNNGMQEFVLMRRETRAGD